MRPATDGAITGTDVQCVAAPNPDQSDIPCPDSRSPAPTFHDSADADDIPAGASRRAHEAVRDAREVCRQLEAIGILPRGADYSDRDVGVVRLRLSPVDWRDASLQTTAPEQVELADDGVSIRRTFVRQVGRTTIGVWCDITADDVDPLTWRRLMTRATTPQPGHPDQAPF